jgi:hypothetical protein
VAGFSVTVRFSPTDAVRGFTEPTVEYVGNSPVAQLVKNTTDTTRINVFFITLNI